MNTRLADYHDCETLPGGQRLRLRAIRPEDSDRLREEFLKLSKATVRDRFFAIKQDLTPAELDYLTRVDFEHHVALVAELETDTGLCPVAVGRLVRRSERPDHSEIAITVADDMQGKGIGKVMLDRLIGCAREIGVSRVDASVLAENTRMLKLIRKTGLALESSLEDGIRTISVSL